MSVLNSPRKFFPFLFILILVGSVSCVEDGYDLNDLDTKLLTAGDKWALPLGRGVVAASEILDVDNVDEIYTDANGDYIARYTDVISVLPDELPSIKRQDIKLRKMTLDLPAVILPTTYFDLPKLESSLDIKGNDQIINLYWADLFTGPDKSLVTLDMTFDGYTLPNCRLDLTIVLPEGYIIDRDYYSEAVDDRTIEWTIFTSGSQSYKTTFPVKRIDMRGDNNISISGRIYFNQSPSVSGNRDILFTVTLHDMEHEVIYADFEIDFESTPMTADISKLYDIFEDDEAVLSFRDPHIIIEAESNIGMPVAAELDIYADTDDGSGAVHIPELLIPAVPYYGSGEPAHASFWIGATRPASAEYIFKETPGLGRIISDANEYIYLAGSGRNADTAQDTFFPSNARADLNYTVGIPLAPASDFRAVSKQVIEDAFDDDIIEYLFNGGTAEIYGTVKNAIPLKFMLEMVITDWDHNPVGIVLEPQPVAGPVSSTEPSVSSISFPFSESDVAKMASARNIELRFVAQGIDNAPTLNVDHELVLNLKLRKTGGIVISTDDDDEE